MAAKTTVANYSDDQVARIEQAAVAAGGKINAAVAEMLAVEMAKSVRSLVAKASRMGLYAAKTYVRKDDTPVQKKDEFATAIGNILRLSEADTDSLAKANRKGLQAIFNALANSTPIDG
jgi:hypothetical protein